MREEELIETLKLFEKERVEQLPENARNLFYAIMKIANERDNSCRIIKELEEHLLNFIQNNKNKNDDRTITMVTQTNYIYNLLQELKGSDKK